MEDSKSSSSAGLLLDAADKDDDVVADVDAEAAFWVVLDMEGDVDDWEDEEDTAASFKPSCSSSVPNLRSVTRRKYSRKLYDWKLCAVDA